jgi:hypothetical protein
VTIFATASAGASASMNLNSAVAGELCRGCAGVHNHRE